MIREKLKILYKQLDTMHRLFDDPSVYTRKLIDHYIQLIMNAIDPETGERTHIQIEEIFESRGGRTAANKIVIVGDSGEGKTTMVHQMLPHAWAHGKLFGEFTHVFRLNLKLLASNNWQASYAGLIQDDPLSCFVHYSSNQSIEKRHRIDYQEFKLALTDPQIQDTTLLLLDGFDEISHLLHDSQIKNILAEALDFKHVIMTSRPNALSNLIENEFDLKIEVVGFDENSAAINIQQYFSKQKDALIAKLEHVINSIVSTNGELEAAVFHHFKISRDPLDQEVLIQLKRIAGPTKQLGTTKEAIIKKIEAYYKVTQETLASLLENQEIKELVSTPMNAEMLCLVCSDPEVRERFVQDFTITELYKEVIILMGKRFISKNLSESSTKVRFIDITDAQVLNSRELIILKEIAYEAFKNGNLIHGSAIEQILAQLPDSLKMNIRSLYDFGLLKIVTQSNLDQNDDLLNQEHTFVHLSFQEYLAATLLTEKLMSDDIVTAREAAQFIASHRNEPKFLTLLKFVANMVTKLPDEHTIAVTRFWEAVECNIEGVLELGVDRKVTLFMHLLSHAKKNGQLDERIPNLTEVKKLINEVVEENLGQWKEVIRQSGYLSTSIEAKLWETLLAYQRTSPIPVMQDSYVSKVEAALQISASEKSVGEMQKTSSILSLTPPVEVPMSSSSDQQKSTSSLFRSESLSNNVAEVILMIELADGVLDKIDKSRLLTILANNLKLHEHWQIVQSSIAVMSKIIKSNIISRERTQSIGTPQGLDLSTDASSEISSLNGSSLSSQLIILLNHENLHKFIVTLLEIIIAKNPQEHALILDQLFEFISDPVNIKRDNLLPPLAQLIHSLVIKEPELLPKIFNSLIPLIHYDGNAMMSIASGRSQYSHASNSHDNGHNEIHNNAMSIIEMLIKKIPETTNLALHYLNQLSDNLEIKDNVAFILWKTLMVNKHEAQDTIFTQVISYLKQQNLSVNHIKIINIVLDNDIKLNIENASDLLYMLFAALDKDISLDITIEAILKIINIAEDIEMDISNSLINKLMKLAASDSNNISNVSMLYTVLAKLAIFCDGPADIENMSDHNAQKILDQLMPLLSAGNAKVAVAIATLVTRAVDCQYIPEDIVDNFTKILVQQPGAHIMEAILIVVENPSIRERMIAQVVNSIVSLTNVNSYTVELLNELSHYLDTSTVDQLLSPLVHMLDQQGDDSAILVTTIIHLINLASATQLNEILGHLVLNFIKDYHDQTISNSLYIIAHIIARQPSNTEVNSLLLEGTIMLLHDPKNKLNAAYLLDILFDHKIHSDSLPNNLVTILNTLLVDMDITSCIASSINKIIDQGLFPEKKIKELSDILTKLNEVPIEAQANVNNLRTKIFDFLPIVQVIDLLQHQNSAMQPIATEILLKRLNVDEAAQETWNKQLVYMLRIMSKTSGIDYSSKKLYEKAKQNLHSQLRKMEGDDAKLQWINNNFEELLSKTSKIEAIAMMKVIFLNTLKDNRITETESKFLSLCIEKLNFTVTISSPQRETQMTAQSQIGPIEQDNIEFIIQFDGMTYRFYGEENRKYIEQIANTALDKTEDRLVEQYRSYVPVFQNTGSGIVKAATDVAECRSFLDKQDLSGDNVHFSFVYLSDALKRKPTDVFVLMEQRIFGHYLAYKIFIRQSGKLSITEYKHHPNELDAEFRMKIFGKMEYDNTKLRYYSKSFDMSLAESEELINSVDTNKALLHQYSVYSKFVLSNIVHMYPPSPQHKRHAGNFDFKEKEVSAELYDFIAKIINLEVRGITGVWSEDAESFEMIGRKDLILVDRNDSDKIDLKSLVKIQDLKEKAQREVNEVIQDPYKEAFYLEIIGQLNSVYIASSAIHSEMVANQSKGTVGNIGSILNNIAPNIPFGGGVIVDLVGSILGELDALQQAEKVENYFHFARDAVVMSEIAERIARKLALAELNIIAESTDLIAVGMHKLSTLLEDGVAGNIVAIGKAAVDHFAEEKESEDPQRDAQVEKGKHDGAIVAKEIIKNIFAGKYIRSTHLSLEIHPHKNKANMVIKDIQEIYVDVSNHAEQQETTLTPPESNTPSIVSIAVDDDRKAVDPGAGGCKCIIMRAMLDDLTREEAFQEILTLASSEERIKAQREYLNEKFPECVISQFALTTQGRDLLNRATQLYGQKAFEQMFELGKDEEVAAQILALIEEQGIERALEVFFSPELQQVIDDFDKITAHTDDSHGFNQYVMAALRGNKFATQLMTKITSLYAQVEEWLSQGISAHQMAIQLGLLEDLLSYAASGMQITTAFRPPAPGPGDHDDFGGGGNGGSDSSGGGQGGNYSESSIYAMPFLSNITFTGDSNNYIL